MKTIALTGLALGMLATAPAFAMEPTMPRAPKIFAKLDTNSDGRITPDELRPKAEARLLRADGDKNGVVTSAEIDAVLRRALELRRNRILRMLDADKNGAITTAELDAYVGMLLKSADTDADGGVSLEEARSFKLAKLAK